MVTVLATKPGLTRDGPSESTTVIWEIEKQICTILRLH